MYTQFKEKNLSKKEEVIMKKSTSWLVVGISVVLLLTLLQSNGETINAQQCRVIRLQGTVYPTTTIRIEPKVVRIAKGTCVIWSNWVRTGEVQIAFEEGKKCEDMTDSPVGFKMDAQNCYVTSFVSRGETSSLMFNEVGMFDYTVKAGAGKEQGKILVE